jgi:hypothetical protein
MLEGMGLSASTPGARGDQRHAVLLKRISDVYDDEDASNSDLSDEDDYRDSVAPPANIEEPYIKRRYFPSKDKDFGFDKPKSKSKAKGRKKKEEQPEPRDWASTASYNDDYDVISHTSRTSMQSDEDEDEDVEVEVRKGANRIWNSVARNLFAPSARGILTSFDRARAHSRPSSR